MDRLSLTGGFASVRLRIRRRQSNLDGGFGEGRGERIVSLALAAFGAKHALRNQALQLLEPHLITGAFEITELCAQRRVELPLGDGCSIDDSHYLLIGVGRALTDAPANSSQQSSCERPRVDR